MDIRTQLPECPLEYEVPFIPGDHTALVISIDAADIAWQEKMLPWTLASLINNTDIIMQGIHLYIACGDETESRIRSALSNFDFTPDQDPILYCEAEVSPVLDGYAKVKLFNINHWAFRDDTNKQKLTYTPDTYISSYPHPDFFFLTPAVYDMTHCTPAQFRRAIKHLMAAQLAMEI